MGPLNVGLLALHIPEIITIGFLGGVRTPILGKGRPYWVGDGAVGKSVGKFHSNFSSICTPKVHRAVKRKSSKSLI